MPTAQKVVIGFRGLSGLPILTPLIKDLFEREELAPFLYSIQVAAAQKQSYQGHITIANCLFLNPPWLTVFDLTEFFSRKICGPCFDSRDCVGSVDIDECMQCATVCTFEPNHVLSICQDCSSEVKTADTHIYNVCSKKKYSKLSSVLLLRMLYFFFGTDVTHFSCWCEKSSSEFFCSQHNLSIQQELIFYIVTVKKKFDQLISVLSSNSLLLHLFCFGQAKVLLRFSSPLFYFLLCQENVKIQGGPLSKNQNVHLKLPQSNVRFMERLGVFFTHIN